MKLLLMLPDWFSGWTYLAIFTCGICVGLTMAIMLPVAFAQTPTVINPPLQLQVLNS